MKKVLSFGTCLALGLSVVGASSALAEEAKFYFDNTTTNWETVNVWAWAAEDEFWAGEQGFAEWPGIALEKDAATGYYVYDCADYLAGANIMFNGNGGAVQTNDAAAAGAQPGYVCKPTDADEEGKFNATWEAVEAAAEEPAAEEPAAEEPAAEEPAAEEPAAEVPAAEEPAAEAPAADAGKTADAAPIAAVAMLGLVSMAVVVATRKKIA